MLNDKKTEINFHHWWILGKKWKSGVIDSRGVLVKIEMKRER
jgi:hypothetical protein